MPKGLPIILTILAIVITAISYKTYVRASYTEGNELNYTLSQNFSIDDQDKVIIIDEQEYKDIKSLIEQYPHLLNQENIEALIAFQFHFFDFDDEYTLINDVALFEKQYMEQIKNEDKGEEFDPYKPRLNDFGIAAFEHMHNGKLVDDMITFYVQDNFTKLPYKISGSVYEVLKKDDLEPVQMKVAVKH